MMLSKKNSEVLENFSEKLEVEGCSFWQDVCCCFMYNCVVVISLIMLVLIVLFVIFVLMVLLFFYFDIDWGMMFNVLDMVFGYYFGIDFFGCDLLVCVVIGGCILLMVGVVVVLVVVIFGMLYGLFFGYFGGKVDLVMMCLLEIFNFFLFMFFVILLVIFFGQNILLIFVVIGIVFWLDMVCIVCGQMLSLKCKEFIEVVQVGGVLMVSIVLCYIVFNVLGVVVVYVLLLVFSMIFFEFFFSFLGLGMQELFSSWGVLFSDGVNLMEVLFWLLLFLVGFLVVILFCFNFIGDGLCDVFDLKDC